MSDERKSPLQEAREDDARHPARMGVFMPKRIYSDVSGRVFESFRLRAKAEGLTIAEALNAITAAYASGDFYVLEKDGKKQPNISFYIKEHQT